MDKLKSRKPPKVDFAHFLEKFPIVELPVTLGEDSIHAFSRENDPLPEAMVYQYLEPGGKPDEEDLSEFIACFRIPETHEFHAVVYWKAALMDYQYVLITYSNRGQIIDRRVIAGTYSDGSKLTTSVATIDPDWIIYVATGQVKGSDDMYGYDAAKSTVGNLELLADGKIINSDEV